MCFLVSVLSEFYLTIGGEVLTCKILIYASPKDLLLRLSEEHSENESAVHMADLRVRGLPLLLPSS